MAVAPYAALATAFAVSVTAVPPLIRVAGRLGIVDRPGPLKVHQQSVAYLGGGAVMAGLIAASWTRAVDAAVPIAPLLPFGLALALGVADDARDLPVVVRIIGELAIGVALAWAVPTRFGALGWVGVVGITLLLINGVNLLDGLDGLAAGVGIASAVGFAVLLRGGGQILALAVTGGLLGFLLYNRPPAKIYLGDGGSYLIGTALTALVLVSWRSGTPIPTSVGSLALVGLPAAEVSWAILRRRRARLPLLAGDRGHSYDRLVERGWSSRGAAAACAAAQAVLAGIGIAASRAGTVVAVLLVALVAVALMLGAGLGGLLAVPPSRDRIGTNTEVSGR